jgi:hypothetical protein
MTSVESSILENSNAPVSEYPEPMSYKATHKIMTPRYVLSSYLNHIASPNLNTALEYTVSLVPSESSILLADYSSSYSNPNKDTTLLPLAVRYADVKRGLYVVERPPFKISPDFSKTKGVGRSVPRILEDKEIWIPWTVSIIHMSSSSSTLGYSMFFNDGPLNSFDDVLTVPWIPNVFADGRTCFGDAGYMLNQRIEAQQMNYNLPEVFNYIFNDFFSSWNADLSMSHHNLFSVFSQLGFLERLKERKRIPKQVFEVYHWYRNAHRAWPIILFALSTLSYQETMQLLVALRETTSATAEKQTLRARFDRKAQNVSAEAFEFNHESISGQYNTLLRADHNSLIDNAAAYYKLNVSVTIQNVPENISLVNSEQIKNPLILSQVYSTFFQHLNASFKRLVQNGVISLDQHASVESLFVYENILNNSQQLDYLKNNTAYYPARTNIDWNTL